MSKRSARLLLLSNSKNYGGGWLDHAEPWIRAFMGGVKNAIFVPYAGVTVSWEDYTTMARERFEKMGIAVTSVHEAKNAAKAVASAEAVFVGGGNTFNLLKTMYDDGSLWAIRERVLAGAPYIGWSAGSNVACPSIRTTNDMPIVEPSKFDALRLVPFQINPHFTDAMIPNHGGETRTQRIAEFTKTNPGVYVVGLREGSAIEVDGAALRLLGPHEARIFHGDRDPVDCAPDASLDFLWEV
ncbi:MAG: dipeptidase PepE [Candidatus Krumholzibacteria bacterium]|nr:dipeptidase PepE [Candidatus Krumholzibacteria bacterium]MDH4336809.1 dipeptidase PepE [Candidatus Krumholzibacteria bacterium]MDH5269424.1 dipeptidase PepE [Candidatus Krumholzibacteria bacterium]